MLVYLLGKERSEATFGGERRSLQRCDENDWNELYDTGALGLKCKSWFAAVVTILLRINCNLCFLSFNLKERSMLRVWDVFTRRRSFGKLLARPRGFADACRGNRGLCVQARYLIRLRSKTRLSSSDLLRDSTSFTIGMNTPIRTTAFNCIRIRRIRSTGTRGGPRILFFFWKANRGSV
jgi:hypothetical protein